MIVELTQPPPNTLVDFHLVTSEIFSNLLFDHSFDCEE